MVENAEEKKWWEKIPVLNHIVHGLLWMLGKSDD